MNSHWTRMHTAGLLVLLVFIFVVAGWAGKVDVGQTAPWSLYGVLGLLAAFIVVAGHGVNGRFAGFLIDARNKMTLSRLQLILWTLVVLSAYLAVVVARIKTQGLEALNVAIPQELWWLMGISTTSMVGSPLVLSNKKNKTPDPKQKKQMIRLMAAQEGVAESVVTSHQDNVGTIVVNKSPQRARFADLFRGDETGNAAHLDLGKIQMFFFTIVLVLAYFFTLQDEFPNLLAQGAEFPAVSEGMVTLLGISHAGYLADKSVPHS